VLGSIRDPAESGWLSWGIQPRTGEGKGWWREAKVISKQLHTLCFPAAPAALVGNVMLCVPMGWCRIALKGTYYGTLFLPLQPPVCLCAGTSWELAQYSLWLYCAVLTQGNQQ